MNCSASAGPTRQATRCRRAACCVLVAAFGMSASASVEAQGAAELDDAASRSQYAFLTNDVRALEALLAEIAQTPYEANLASLKSYQLAYGHWKLAQLNAQRGAPARAAAGKAAKACVEYAKTTVEQDGQFAEAYALLAICESKPYATLVLKSLSEGECDRHRALRTALSLAPKNPRVRFVSALCSGSAQGEAHVLRWREVVEAFDGAPKPRTAVVDWGHAEALTLLAQVLLSAEQSVAARDAVERALVIAPDYEHAQAVLNTIAETR